MIRLLFITDYTEQFSYKMLKGITNHSDKSEKWVINRMLPSYMRTIGLEGIVEWAKKWKADVVIGQFAPGDDLSLFERKGIIVIAQDYIQVFPDVPNITADYQLTGKMAAEHFLTKGYSNFAFFGYKGVCWSEKRFEGFRDKIVASGHGDRLYLYDGQKLDNIWYYNSSELEQWLRDIPKPIAIMACDDNQGNLLLNVCNSIGIKIPNDVAVLGVDNDEVIDNLSDPTLSSIEVDIEQGGYELASMVEKMIKTPGYRGNDVVLRPVSVILRASTSVYATKDKEIVKALRFINDNIDKPIAVADILKEVPLSRRLLEIRFKKVTGSTVYSYISNRRIERFAHLLVQSNRTVSEITAMFGETDYNSICRRFKQIMGCSPIEYRKRASHK